MYLVRREAKVEKKIQNSCFLIKSFHPDHHHNLTQPLSTPQLENRPSRMLIL